jgi:hypothetical protein
MNIITNSTLASNLEFFIVINPTQHTFKRFLNPNSNATLIHLNVNFQKKILIKKLQKRLISSM